MDSNTEVTTINVCFLLGNVIILFPESTGKKSCKCSGYLVLRLYFGQKSLTAYPRILLKINTSLRNHRTVRFFYISICLQGFLFIRQVSALLFVAAV